MKRVLKSALFAVILIMLCCLNGCGEKFEEVEEEVQETEVLQPQKDKIAGMTVCCQPVIPEGSVEIEEMDLIYSLAQALEGCTFEYVGTIDERDDSAKELVNGSSSHFFFCDEDDVVLLDFGYDGFNEGYVWKKGSLLYQLVDDDEEINDICSEIIEVARVKMEKEIAEQEAVENMLDK